MLLFIIHEIFVSCSARYPSPTVGSCRAVSKKTPSWTRINPTQPFVNGVSETLINVMVVGLLNSIQCACFKAQLQTYAVPFDTSIPYCF